MPNQQLTFYEFFAGGGMARLGLGERWKCLFANDCCERKARAYRENYGASPELLVRDIRQIMSGDLPGEPTLAWASFPCQDLSLAGNGFGLKGERSGTFWEFWRLMQGLANEGRSPRLIVLENVVGAITSNAGRDFRSIVKAIASAGYRVGAFVVNAVHFVPQSRPRLFVLAVDAHRRIPDNLITEFPNPLWHPATLQTAYNELPATIQEKWAWWNLPMPTMRRESLSELIEEKPTTVTWLASGKTRALLAMMSKANVQKVEKAKRLRKPVVGTVYRRTRQDESGKPIQRAEVRFDQISGCLRTPVGGSSRQTILIVDGESIRARLLSPREAARLMGVPDTYTLPDNYNEAYHLMGDGVVVPVVGWIETHLLLPLALSTIRDSEAA